MYVEYEELTAFLTVVSRGTSELRKACPESANSDARLAAPELEHLNPADWAHLWMQVIRQLREGIKLRKVMTDAASSRSEFELTPFEMLLSDIRLRRYKLKHVSREQMPVKKDAHDVILEFIRSRPPLVPVSRRATPPTPPRLETPRELLLKSIREGRRLRPVPCASRRSSSSQVGRVLGDDYRRAPLDDGPQPPLPSRKQVIRADAGILSFESEDEDYDGRSTHSQADMRDTSADEAVETVCDRSSGRREEVSPQVRLSLFSRFRNFTLHLIPKEKSQATSSSATPMHHVCDSLPDGLISS